ncbi:MAG TPA: efflux RND transporter permease subunit, partial [Candidatus Angelobacter sp.]|nr:efflux RND transporter permease subunit [Candidatus Angelobacter sp.]
MLKRIVDLSLRNRGIVVALACVLIGYGLFVASNAKLDVFPEFVQPQVTVQAEAPGLAPEQVESLVTRPIESVLNGAGNLQSIRSESIQGLSVVTAVFKEGTDIYIARQLLTENLAQLSGQLPAGVKAPTMSPLTSSTMDLLKFGLISKKMSPMQLRTFADWVVKPRLLSVQGVAGVKVFGGEVRQIQIQVKSDRLAAFGLSLEDVLAAARASTGVRGAGFIETAPQRVVLQTEGQSLTPQQIGQVVVAQHEGQSVRLKDVADVLEAPQPPFGSALIMGRPGILMTTASQYLANTMDVTKEVEKALEDLKPVFQSEGIEYVPGLHRPATFIENAIHNMKSSLLLGAALVAVVLFLFLFDLRTAFISFTAIPLSLLAAVIVLDHAGVTLNTMTLGGLAAVIGVVVDDAIITVENILRRMRENLGRATPRPLFQVVLDAALEVRSAVVYATFVVALVFLPVLTMSGLQGRFFGPLGIAFILANLASLVVALTVTPGLCLLVLSRIKPHTEPGYIAALKALHRRALERVSRAPRTVLGAALALFIAATATLPFLGGAFMPDFREGHFVVQISTAPGTSLVEMLRLGGRISEELLKNPGIQTVEQQAGRAEMGEDTWGPHRSEFHVELKHDSNLDEAKVQDEIRETLAKFPGIQFEVLTFLGDRIGETISGETASVVVNIFGDDLDVLDQKANEVSSVLSSVPGAADVQVKAPPGAPRLAIRLRADRVTQFGFRPVDLLAAVETAYQGTVVAQTYEGNRVFDVLVILSPAERRDPETVGSLMLANAQGVRLPLRELADVYLTTGRYSILHDGARRRQTVTCNPSGRDVASFVADARKQIAAKVELPAGVYLEFTGAAQEQANARQELLIHSLIAGVGIVILLAVVFRQGRNLLLVLANVPFALVGGVFAVVLFSNEDWSGTFSTLARFGVHLRELLSHPLRFSAHPIASLGNLWSVLSAMNLGMLSLGTMVGFVTLFGITMRNSIMMVSHFEHLVREEGMTWGLEAALRGATERLVPILMTALVTALGLLPLAIG